VDIVTGQPSNLFLLKQIQDYVKGMAVVKITRVEIGYDVAGSTLKSLGQSGIHPRIRLGKELYCTVSVSIGGNDSSRLIGRVTITDDELQFRSPGKYGGLTDDRLDGLPNVTFRIQAGGYDGNPFHREHPLAKGSMASIIEMSRAATERFHVNFFIAASYAGEVEFALRFPTRSMFHILS